MSDETTGRLLRLQGSPIDDLVRFEDRGTVDGRRLLVLYLLTTTADGVCAGRLSENQVSYVQAGDREAWPVWQFPAMWLDTEIRLSLAGTVAGRDPGHDFGTEAASERAYHAPVALEFITPDGETRRWSADDRAEFANVSLRRNAVRYAEVQRSETKRLLTPIDDGRRELVVVINARWLWDAGWLSGLE